MVLTGDQNTNSMKNPIVRFLALLGLALLGYTVLFTVGMVWFCRNDFAHESRRSREYWQDVAAEKAEQAVKPEAPLEMLPSGHLVDKEGNSYSPASLDYYLNLPQAPNYTGPNYVNPALMDVYLNAPAANSTILMPGCCLPKPDNMSQQSNPFQDPNRSSIILRPDGTMSGNVGGRRYEGFIRPGPNGDVYLHETIR